MATQTDKPSYKQTLNLPQTPFPMEAKLTANEPARLAAWREMDLYGRVQRSRAESPAWVLHDGPPFANGDIHIGHVINKTLKDALLRFKTLQGYRTPYVPGWDCHGLPIEHKIGELAKKAGERLHELGTVEVRRRCFEYAAKYVDVQSEQFQRLGILGEWRHPYRTMDRAYEAGHAGDVRQVRRGRAGVPQAEAGAVEHRQPDGAGGCRAGVPGRGRQQRLRGVPRRRPGCRVVDVRLRLWCADLSARLDDDALDVASKSSDRGRPGREVRRCPVRGGRQHPHRDRRRRVDGARVWRGVRDTTRQQPRFRTGHRSRIGGSGRRLPTPVYRPYRQSVDGRLRDDRRRHRPGPHRAGTRRGRLRDGPAREDGRLQPRAGQRQVRRHRARLAGRQERVGGEQDHPAAPGGERSPVRRADDQPQLPARLAEQDADHLSGDRAVVRGDGPRVHSLSRYAGRGPG